MSVLNRRTIHKTASTWSFLKAASSVTDSPSTNKYNKKRATNQLNNNGGEFANEEDRQIFRMARIMQRLIAPCTFHRNDDSALENRKNTEMA